MRVRLLPVVAKDAVYITLLTFGCQHRCCPAMAKLEACAYWHRAASNVAQIFCCEEGVRLIV